jgi:molecular chaperone GrpE
LTKDKAHTKNKHPHNGKEPTFKKGDVDYLKKQLEAEQEKTKDYQTRLMYLQADMENYRKRMNKDFDEITRYGSQRLILKLLPIVDDLEYAIEAGKNSKQNNGLLEGMEMVLKKFYDALKREGVSKIDAIGKPFDPSNHEAAEKVIIEALKEGTVVEEIRKGYVFKERVIRPSLVKVTIKPKKEKSNQEG